jgi:hypothetical protein
VKLLAGGRSPACSKGGGTPIRSLGFSLAISFSLIGLLPVGASDQERGLAARVAQLEAQVEALTAALQDAQEILQYVHVETGEINYLST